MAQFKVDENFQNYMTAPSALDNFCHPLGKIQAIGEIITALNIDLSDRPFPDVSTGAVFTLGEIIEDAVQDLEFLLDLARKQANEARSECQVMATEIFKSRQREQQETA